MRVKNKQKKLGKPVRIIEPAELAGQIGRIVAHRLNSDRPFDVSLPDEDGSYQVLTLAPDEVELIEGIDL